MLGLVGSTSGVDLAALTEKLQSRFEKFDVNGDGSIQYEEAESVVKDLGRFESLFSKLDVDGDGSITKAEHEAGVEKFTKKLSNFTEHPGADLVQLLFQRANSDQATNSSVQNLLAQSAYQRASI